MILVRICRFSALLVFLLFAAGSSEARETMPEKFYLSVQLKHPEVAGKTIRLQRGALLEPELEGSEDRYQPVILCTDLELHLNEQGVSQEVNVYGFCLGAGLPAAGDFAGGFKWTITKAFSPEVRELGCAPELLKKIRRRQTLETGPWSLGPATWTKTCDEPTSQECLDFFDEETRKDKKLGTDHQTLINERICHRTFLLNDQREWKGALLECWPERWKRR